MADPIKHDFTSSVSTAGWETAKGAVAGVAAPTVAGAVVGAVAWGALAAVGTAVATAVFATAGVTAVPVLIAAAIGAGLGGLAGGAAVGIATAPLAGFFAAAGALLGLAKGGDRISKENQAYGTAVENRVNPRSHQQAKKVNDAEIRGMQQGYMLGAQEAEQRIVSQLQQAAMQQEQMAHAAPPAVAVAGAVAKAECKAECGPHTKAVIEKREAQAAAGVANGHLSA